MTITVTLSSKNQIVVPREARQNLHERSWLRCKAGIVER